MISFKHLITVPVSITAFVSTFYVVGKLMLFLSTPSKISSQYVWVLNLLDNYSRLEAALAPFTTDIILILLFVLQHSFIGRASFIKWFLSKLGLGTIERSLYNIGTAATLYVSKNQ